MKVKKGTDKATPEYLTKRQFRRCGVVLGAAAVALGTITGGCRSRTGGVVPESAPMVEPTPLEFTRTGGVVFIEPRVCAYVVQQGDTLYGIAQRSLGNGNRWREIAAANPGITPKSLKVGQTLTLPDVPAK